MNEAFDSNALAALLIGTQMKLPICDECDPAQFEPLRCAEIAKRLNATIWDRNQLILEVDVQPIVKAEDEGICCIYGCETDAVVRIRTLHGNMLPFCEEHRLFAKALSNDCAITKP